MPTKFCPTCKYSKIMQGTKRTTIPDLNMSVYQTGTDYECTKDHIAFFENDNKGRWVCEEYEPKDE